MERLVQFPESGRRVPELPGTLYREVIVDSYRVLYRYDTTKQIVSIVAVTHGSRSLPALEEGP